MEITDSGGGTRVSRMDAGMADVVEADNRTIGCSGKRGGAAVPEALPRPGAMGSFRLGGGVRGGRCHCWISGGGADPLDPGSACAALKGRL